VWREDEPHGLDPGSETLAIAYHPSPRPTLGIEEEYQLCDPGTGDLVPVVERVIEAADGSLTPHLGYDLLSTLVEVNTGVNETVEAAMEDLLGKRRAVQRLAEATGCTLGLTGTHPFADPKDQGFVDTPDYQWVADQLGYVAQRNLTFGLHVHVGVDDGDRALYVTNRLRQWIGPLIALAANSPFLDGVDTGWNAARIYAFGAFPRAGIPPRIGSWDEFSDQVERLIEAGAITKPRQIWWNVRAHPEYGTVEVRVFDMQASLPRTATMVALSQALVVTYAEAHRRGEPELELPGAYLEDLRWKGMRFGLDADVVDPLTGEVLSMPDYVRRMVEQVRPAAGQLGLDGYLDQVSVILEEGNGATRQRALHASFGGDLRATQLRLLEEARLTGIESPEPLPS